jgi:hypothetical protein
MREGRDGREPSGRLEATEQMEAPMAEKTTRAGSSARREARSDRPRTERTERERGRNEREQRADRTARGRGSRSRADREQPRIAAPNATRDERRWIEDNAGELSKTTLRAKWIHGDERADRNGQTLATRDPDVIRRWAEDRGGRPAAASRERDGGRPRTLRIDFPAGGSSRRLEPISWEE